MRTVPAVTGLTCLTLLLLTAAFIADRAFQQAGAWALLGLSLTVGFAHGALDAAVMQRRFTNRLVLVKWLAAYLAAVVLLGWLLSSAINVALWALILMSIWHFGEPYGRWNGLQSGSAHLTRAVVGGAPIMLPVWLAPEGLASTLAPVVDTVAIEVWHAMASIWLALWVVWLVVCGVPRMKASRFAWAELAGCALAYAALSPLMAFALYFGLYHAPVHIWRVARSALAGGAVRLNDVATAAVGLVATLGATWALGAGLWWLLSPDFSAMPEMAAALRWLIVALAAVTAPHLVLISVSAAWLARGPADTAA